MSWVSTIIGTLILTLGFVVFLTGVKKGERWNYIKEDIKNTVPIVTKALTVIMLMSGFFHWYSDGQLMFSDSFIALTVLIILYSVGKGLLEIIIYTVKFIKNKEWKEEEDV